VRGQVLNFEFLRWRHDWSRSPALRAAEGKFKIRFRWKTPCFLNSILRVSEPDKKIRRRC
jgi:hypothetical protein